MTPWQAIDRLRSYHPSRPMWRGKEKVKHRRPNGSDTHHDARRLIALVILSSRPSRRPPKISFGGSSFPARPRAPRAQREDDRLERPPARRERVLDARRDFREDLSRDQPI